METIKCPSCRRILNLPASLRGTEVQCPGCHTTFVPPRDEDPSVGRMADPPYVPPASLVPRPTRPAQVGGPPEAFDFNDEEQARYYRTRRKVDRAASWLRRTVLFDFFPTFLCCPVIIEIARWVKVPEGEPLVVAMLAGGLFILCPNVLVLAGLHYLTRRRFVGLVMTTGLLAFVVALKDLMLAFWLVQGLLQAVRLGPCVSLLILGLLALAAAATVNGVIGGIQTLTVLNDPEVRRDFR
jgi:LSD1 subclass zinc finger protein